MRRTQNLFAAILSAVPIALGAAVVAIAAESDARVVAVDGDAAVAVGPISAKTYDKLRTLVKPLPDQQQWNHVKWQLTLWEAQALAAKEGKPIAVMATGGEPLGIC